MTGGGDLLLQSAGVLRQALAAGELTSEALVTAQLERIARLNPPLNAIVALDPDRALAEARAADAARARGLPAGVLAGIPMTIKDSLEVAGFPAVCGAPALRDYRPARDAIPVARLRAAGAIILGKTNVPLYAADLQTFNEVFGVTRNPYALDRTPGGSSGGAAAALAAGLTPLELGSDLCGSLRIPAHACGVASLKPSYGVVPLEGSLSGPPGRRRRGDLWVVGPLARTVADLATMLDIVAVPTDPEACAWSLALPGPPPGRRPRVALWWNEALCPPEPEVVRHLTAAARGLEEAGLAQVEEARPGISPEAHFLTHCGLMYAEMAGGMPGDVADYFARRAARPRAAPGLDNIPDLMAAGLSATHRQWQAWCETREQLREVWAGFFTRYDALLCPAYPTVAPLHDARRLDQRTHPVGPPGQPRELPALLLSFWASLASTAYLPAVTVPLGTDSRGLPVGGQLIGPYLQDRALLALGAALEQVTGGFRPPALVQGSFRGTADA